MKMSDGGKGSDPRPLSVTLEEYGNSYTRIYGNKSKYCSTCDKLFSWCECVQEEKLESESKEG